MEFSSEVEVALCGTSEIAAFSVKLVSDSILSSSVRVNVVRLFDNADFPNILIQ